MIIIDIQCKNDATPTVQLYGCCCACGSRTNGRSCIVQAPRTHSLTQPIPKPREVNSSLRCTSWPRRHGGIALLQTIGALVGPPGPARRALGRAARASAQAPPSELSHRGRRAVPPLRHARTPPLPRAPTAPVASVRRCLSHCSRAVAARIFGPRVGSLRASLRLRPHSPQLCLFAVACTQVEHGNLKESASLRGSARVRGGGDGSWAPPNDLVLSGLPGGLPARRCRAPAHSPAV